MSKVPEGVETTEIEGHDLSSALEAAAEALGVKPHQVAHKIDLSHFRSELGTSVPRDTVKIVAWVDPDADEEAPAARKPAKKARKPRSDDDDGGRDRGRDRGSDDRRTPAGGSTPASEFAQAWFATLLEHLGVEGTVEATGDDDRVHVRIQPESKAGRLIGRRGATLSAIRHLLGLALESHGSPTIDVDVDDDRKGGKPSRSGRRDDDGDRGRGKRKRSRKRGRSDDKGTFDEDKLRALARKAAEKARSTGKTITINLDLNSYDRRIVHLEVSEFDGVDTRSIEKDGGKRVQVFPD
jgi:predicted RNA-binding protein Jag